MCSKGEMREFCLLIFLFLVFSVNKGTDLSYTSSLKKKVEEKQLLQKFIERLKSEHEAEEDGTPTLFFAKHKQKQKQVHYHKNVYDFVHR